MNFISVNRYESNVMSIFLVVGRVYSFLVESYRPLSFSVIGEWKFTRVIEGSSSRICLTYLLYCLYLKF